MARGVVHFVICLVAAAAPLLLAAPGEIGSRGDRGEVVWPERFEGRVLTPLPLTARELKFSDDFPGHVARFSDGQREVIIRYVTEATRMLHAASDCLRGVGYSITPSALEVDANGNKWSAFRAVRGTDVLNVRERIFDEQGHSWTDVSAWYWAVMMGRAEGPSWAVTVAASLTPMH